MDASQILNDVQLAIDLIARVKAAIDGAKGDIAVTTLEEAKARLAQVQLDAIDLDATFDAALAASQA